MRFVVDAQLPPALARRLTALGHTAEHVVDLGLIRASDNEIRVHAKTIGAAIITKDEDFAVHRILNDGPNIVWMRTGNTSRSVLLHQFEAALPMLLAALERGEPLVELT